MDLGDFRDDPWGGDVLDERYLIDRQEHEAHAEGNDEEPDDEPEPFEACGAVAHLPGKPPQPPCRRPKGHTAGPDVVDYHSNGLLKWPVKRSVSGVVMYDVLSPDKQPRTLSELVDDLIDGAWLAGRVDIYDGSASYLMDGEAYAKRAEVERRLRELRDAGHTETGVSIADLLDGKDGTWK